MQYRSSLLTAAALVGLASTPAAQWADSFDSYTTGSLLVSVSTWDEWDGNTAQSETALADPGMGAAVRSAPNSVWVRGTSDTLHEFGPGQGGGPYTSGTWALTAYQYLPSTTTGFSMTESQWFLMMNQYDHGGPYNHSVQVEMDPLTGNYRVDTAGGSYVGACVFDQWVELRADIDLDADTVQLFYDHTAVGLPYPWNGGVPNYGSGASEIAAVGMYAGGAAGSASRVYYDDFSLLPPTPPTHEFFGLRNVAQGSAIVTPDSGTGSLIVSNLGSSGCDGVRIQLNDATEGAIPPGAHGVDLEWNAFTSFPGGAWLGLYGVGEVNNVPGLLALANTSRVGATLQLSVSFPPASTQAKTVELFRDGQRVACFEGVTMPGTFATVTTALMESPLGGGLAWRYDPVLQDHTEELEVTWSFRHRYAGTPSVALPVAVGSAPAVLADEVVVRSDTVPNAGRAFDLVDVLLSGASPLVMVSEGVRDFGTRHYAQGAASWDLSGNSGLVDNLGSSGQDGLRLLLEDSETFAIDWGALAGTPDGAGLRQEWTGSWNGAAGATLATLEITQSAGSLAYDVDFPASGCAGWTADLSVFGTPVTTQSYSGTLFGVADWIGAAELLSACPTNGTPRLRVSFDVVALINIPSAGLFAATDIVFYPDCPASGGGRLEELTLLATDLPQLELVDESRSETPTYATYCTAGTSAYGCTPAIGAKGQPSAAASSGFELTVCDVNGNTAGIFFYGINGRQAAPWGGGSSFICVITPVRRTGLVTTTGTSGDCGGTGSSDLAARWTMKPNQEPPVGALVQAQFWYRDPWNPAPPTSMSNALEFVMCP